MTRDKAMASVIRAARIYRDATRNVRMDDVDDPDGDVPAGFAKLDAALAALDDCAAEPATPAAVPQGREARVCEMPDDGHDCADRASLTGTGTGKAGGTP